MKRRRFITKRTCIVLMLLLVGGAIVNVAVAWGIATLLPMQYVISRIGMYGPTESPVWDVSVIARAGAILVDAEARSMARPGPPSNEPIPPWSLTSRLSAQHSPRTAFQEIAYGWPVVSLFHRESCCTWYEGGLLIPWVSRYNPRTLPLILIWPGFAINTVFYAAVLWGLFAVPIALRKRRRIKRGWCPKCAYDLRGRAPTSTACPECGAAV